MADTTNKYNFLDYEGLSLFWNNVKKVIGDNELVTATALTNLNTRVDTVEDALADQIISISYTDLKTLRDNAQLVPGQQYRITDYICTTTQENTRALGHAFDIIVTADNASTINEVARAVKHDGDTYFAGCDLNAWKIWYCLDNDTTRFVWADGTNGKGVIYRMIDEFDNDVPYDFKNIQFKHPNDPTTYPYYYYTFASDNIEDNTDCSLDISSMCYSNTIKNNLSMEGINESPMMLNQIIFIGAFCFCNSFGNLCSNNSFGGGCISNSFGIACSNNAFGFNCSDNTFGDICIDNTFGGDFACNTFGNECQSNTFGGTCQYNTFGNECQYNTFGDRCQSNTFGGDCCRNIFGPYCQNNTFGSSCYYNTFEDGCQYNSFGNECRGNSFGNECSYIKLASVSSSVAEYNYYRNNHFGDGCQYIVFAGAETASASAQVQNYKFAQGLQGTSDEYLAIDGKRNRSYETYISRDTDGTIKESVIADIADKLDKIIETTYANLVSLRESSNLIPGQQYRITDYTCTTTSTGTKSAGHVFDVIVTANDESTLNEVASVVKHNGDEYFANSDLNAWQIWYCLDNDTSRFNWADTTNGKGVIYRMIDEFDNDIPYDFKNIQFKHPKDTTTYPYYYYTFASNNIEDNTDCSLNISSMCYSNTIKNTTLKGENINETPMILNQIIFISNMCVSNTFGYDCNSNSFGAICIYNTFGNGCTGNTFGGGCASNTFGIGCTDNTFGEICSANTFGDGCQSNTFAGTCQYNTVGKNFRDNTFGDVCTYNTFGYAYANNTAGNHFQSNTFGDGCQGNTFGDQCTDNIFGNYCFGNTFGNKCSYNTFGNGFEFNTVGNEFSGNTFGNICLYIKFASDKSDASAKYNYYRNNHFGDGCKYIVFTGTETASSKAQVQNYNFSQGLQGTSDAYLTVDGKRNRVFETKVARNSNGELKIYCEADLIK